MRSISTYAALAAALIATGDWPAEEVAELTDTAEKLDASRPSIGSGKLGRVSGFRMRAEGFRVLDDGSVKFPKIDSSRPHQSSKECARRLRQMQRKAEKESA